MALNEGLSIGALARRTGLAVSAIRYYEAQGLIRPWRNGGGQFGYTLPQIRQELDRLPDGRTPTKGDWTRISKSFRATLDQRIEMLTRLRDDLDGCIGCGCLSLKACALYNPHDKAGEKGQGPRYLMGDPRS